MSDTFCPPTMEKSEIIIMPKFHQLPEMERKTLEEIMDANPLSKFDFAISQDHVTAVFIAGGKMTDLPASFTSLIDLRILTIIGAGLIEMPRIIFSMPSIRFLNLSNNQISQIPREIGNLMGLTMLNLSQNQISEIPQEIGRLNKLFKVNLGNNQISDAPVFHQDKYMILRLNHNRFTQFPLNLCQPNGISHIDLAYNRIALVPKALEKIRLTVLDLSYNQIVMIEPFNITGYICNLNLSHNPLPTLPNCLAEVNLQQLDLSYCQFKHVPNTLDHFYQRLWIDMVGNPLDPEDMIVAETAGLLNNFDAVRAKFDTQRRDPEDRWMLLFIMATPANTGFLREHFAQRFPDY